MNIKHLLFLAIAAATLPASAQTKKTATATATNLPRPKLVVGLVVDQMRWDYLYRYYDRYQAVALNVCLTRVLPAKTPIPYISLQLQLSGQYLYLHRFGTCHTRHSR
jgi:hypothetical protein